jgi:hypothetical protein
VKLIYKYYNFTDFPGNNIMETIMKKINLCIFFLIIFIKSVFADSIDVSAGGAVTGYLPILNYCNSDLTRTLEPPIVTVRRVDIMKTDSLNLLFGFAVSAPVIFTYYFNNGWGVGAEAELGYSFQAGIQVYMNNAPENYVPTDTSFFYHAFLGTFNFIVNTPKLKNDFRVTMEFGLALRAGGLTGFVKSEKYRFLYGTGYVEARPLCYLGPDLFIGFQKDLARSLIIMPGLRMSSEFAYFYDDTNHNLISRDFYLQINLGLEFRLLWNKSFVLPSKGGQGGDAKVKKDIKSGNKKTTKENYK